MTRFKSVLGQPFGDWTVIEEKERGHNRRAKCRCTCGREAMVRVSSLMSGTSTCCNSCKGFESAIGEIYGKLTVMTESETGKNRHVIRECDCGRKDFSVQLTSLIFGHTKSCGCMKLRESYESGFIYYLLDPISMKIRYVGQTVREPNKRLSEHILNIKSNLSKVRWIHSLYPYKPIIITIERNVPLDKLTERENLHIKRCLRRKQPLLNIMLPSEMFA